MQYSIVINSTSETEVALVLSSWTINEEGERVQVASEVKTGMSMEAAIAEAANFVNQE